MVKQLGSTLKSLPSNLKPLTSKPGQALIIMLLVMAVSLTLGVAISSRTITTLRQITYSAQSAEALALAEAGVEDGLKRIKDNPSLPLPYSSGDVTLGDGKFNYTITALGASSAFDALSPISRDKAVQIDLDGYGAGTSIFVNWADRSKGSETSDPAAMEVSIVYLEGGEYKLLRYAWDPTPTRRASNKFFAPSEGIFQPISGGVRYKYRVSVAAPAAPKLLRLRALYTAVPNSFAVSAGAGNLPAQGAKITSTGYVGRVRRKVEATRSQPALSELFDFVLFSGSKSDSLTK